MPSMLASSYVLPILLLVGSNVFMTFAWYGHLRFKEAPLVAVMLASWGIALFEYCMAVPANRWGSAVYSTAQLKTIQEVVTLLIFAGFSVVSIFAAHSRSAAGAHACIVVDVFTSDQLCRMYSCMAARIHHIA